MYDEVEVPYNSLLDRPPTDARSQWTFVAGGSMGPRNSGREQNSARRKCGISLDWTPDFLELRPPDFFELDAPISSDWAHLRPSCPVAVCPTDTVAVLAMGGVDGAEDIHGGSIQRNRTAAR